MIRTVVREHGWPPDKIGGLFVDDQDYEGIEFWYNDCVKVSDEIKAKTPKSKKGK